MPKDAAARKQIQLLEAELIKTRRLVTQSSVLVFKQAAVTSLLIEKGIINNEQINERIQTLLHANSKNLVGLSPKSEGSGTAEDHSRRGKSGLLQNQSDRDDSGKDNPGLETSD